MTNLCLVAGGSEIDDCYTYSVSISAGMCVKQLSSENVCFDFHSLMRNCVEVVVPQIVRGPTSCLGRYPRWGTADVEVKPHPHPTP